MENSSDMYMNMLNNVRFEDLKLPFMKMQNLKIGYYPYHLICGRGPNNADDFINFMEYIKSVLEEEGICQYDYKLSPTNRSVFIDFAYREDMEKILHKRKYENYNNIQICFNTKFAQSDDHSLKMIGLPPDITRKELDNILSKSYSIHEVTKVIPSNEDPDKMYAKVIFNNIDDLNACKENLKQIKGFDVQILCEEDSN